MAWMLLHFLTTKNCMYRTKRDIFHLCLLPPSNTLLMDNGIPNVGIKLRYYVSPVLQDQLYDILTSTSSIKMLNPNLLGTSSQSLRWVNFKSSLSNTTSTILPYDLLDDTRIVFNPEPAMTKFLWRSRNLWTRTRSRCANEGPGWQRRPKAKKRTQR